MFSRVLIPISDSVVGHHAAQVGLMLAHQLNSSVVFLHVLNDHFAPSIDMKSDSRTLESHGEALLEPWMLAARKARVSATTRLEPKQDVAIAVAHVAQDEGCDLILVGTHERDGVSHLIFGSIAERIVHLATVPVMLTRYEEEQKNKLVAQTLAPQTLAPGNAAKLGVDSAPQI